MRQAERRARAKPVSAIRPRHWSSHATWRSNTDRFGVKGSVNWIVLLQRSYKSTVWWDTLNDAAIAIKKPAWSTSFCQFDHGLLARSDSHLHLWHILSALSVNSWIFGVPSLGHPALQSSGLRVSASCKCVTHVGTWSACDSRPRYSLM